MPEQFWQDLRLTLQAIVQKLRPLHTHSIDSGQIPPIARWHGARSLVWSGRALFMGPPAMAAVSVATGDRKYLDLANRLWRKTTDLLYDRDERLYYRDSRYFEQREKNGRKVFWSRGATAG